MSSLQLSLVGSETFIRPLLLILIFALATLPGFVLGLAKAEEGEGPTSAVAAGVASLADPKMTTKEFSQRIVPLTRSQLGEVAETWLKLTQKEVANITSIDLALPDSDEADRERLEADLKDAVQRQDRVFESLGFSSTNGRQKGGSLAK